MATLAHCHSEYAQGPSLRLATGNRLELLHFAVGVGPVLWVIPHEVRPEDVGVRPQGVHGPGVARIVGYVEDAIRELGPAKCGKAP